MKAVVHLELDSGNILSRVRPGDLADKCIAKLYLLLPVVERLNRLSYEIKVVICFLKKIMENKLVVLNIWTGSNCHSASITK